MQAVAVEVDEGVARTPAQKKPMKRIEDFILTRRIKWRTRAGKFSEDVC
jgi:hypothetical protein